MVVMSRIITAILLMISLTVTAAVALPAHDSKSTQVMDRSSSTIRTAVTNGSVSDNQSSSLGVKVGPPPYGVYNSALTDFGGAEDNVTVEKIKAYEQLIGKKIAWAYFSNNWGDGIKFPEDAVKTIYSQGVVPFIRMMPRTTFTDGLEDPVYTLQRFIDGEFDDDLRKWAQDAKRVGIPLMVEFGTEVNGDWFPWSGELNGESVREGYGDPTLPDGPERFRDAYKHIIDLFREEGVNNITWAFHVYADENTGQYSISNPKKNESWNAIANYYPGDDYIDWIGASVYGSFERGTEWSKFTDILDDVYPQLTAISPNKPIAVFEFGVIEDPSKGNKSAWIQNALQSIENGRYPRIKGISYWHEQWNDCINVCVPGLNGMIDLRLDSDEQSLQVYRKMISSSFFVSEPHYLYSNIK